MVNASRFLGASLGTSVHPVTANMLQLGQGMFERFVFIVIAIYAGQLVWREREANISHIQDVLPVPSWVPFASKLFALMAVHALLYMIVILCGVTIQASLGYYEFELSVYLKALIGIEWLHACLICVVAITVQVIVNHKYLGHLVMLGLYVALQYMGEFGIDHHLLQYASHPGYTYSDMNGFGHFVWPIVVFNLYWTAAATMISTLASALRVRGVDCTPGSRLWQLRRRFTSGHRIVTTAALIAFIGLGGFIFYNTNVLNDYRSASTWERQRVNYERRYAEFKDSAQPRIVAVSLQADIFPKNLAVRLSGSYLLENKTTESIRRVLVSQLLDEADVRQLSIGSVKQAIEVSHGTGAHVFALEQPMEPGDTLPLNFDVTYSKPGFTNHKAHSRIVRNGTYIGAAYVPHVGYSTKTELRSHEAGIRTGGDETHPTKRVGPLLERPREGESRNAAIAGSRARVRSLSQGSARAVHASGIHW